MPTTHPTPVRLHDIRLGFNPLLRSLWWTVLRILPATKQQPYCLHFAGALIFVLVHSCIWSSSWVGSTFRILLFTHGH